MQQYIQMIQLIKQLPFVKLFQPKKNKVNLDHRIKPKFAWLFLQRKLNDPL